MSFVRPKYLNDRPLRRGHQIAGLHQNQQEGCTNEQSQSLLLLSEARVCGARGERACCVRSLCGRPSKLGGPRNT